MSTTEDELCLLCGEPMRNHPSASDFQPLHRECSLRSVVGGIGHCLDHARFCRGTEGPDAGLTYRKSAQLVDALVKRFGVDAVMDHPWKDERP